MPICPGLVLYIFVFIHNGFFNTFNRLALALALAFFFASVISDIVVLLKALKSIFCKNLLVLYRN